MSHGALSAELARPQGVVASLVPKGLGRISSPGPPGYRVPKGGVKPPRADGSRGGGVRPLGPLNAPAPAAPGPLPLVGGERSRGVAPWGPAPAQGLGATPPQRHPPPFCGGACRPHPPLGSAQAPSSAIMGSPPRSGCCVGHTLIYACGCNLSPVATSPHTAPKPINVLLLSQAIITFMGLGAGGG